MYTGLLVVKWNRSDIIGICLMPVNALYFTLWKQEGCSKYEKSVWMFFAVYHTPRSSWIMLLQSGFLSPQDSSSQTQWQVFIPASLLYSYIEFGGGKNIRLCKSTLFSQVYTEGTKTFPQKSSIKLTMSELWINSILISCTLSIIQLCWDFSSN